MWHTQSRGQTILIQDGQFDSIVTNDNLDVEDPSCLVNWQCYAMAEEVYAAHGLDVENNTVQDSAWGIEFGETCSSGCYAGGSDMTLENDVVAPASTHGPNYAYWRCVAACRAGRNVSADRSAIGGDSVLRWSAGYATTAWAPNSGPPWRPPPRNYYRPVGLPSTVGYQGPIGP